MSQHNEAINPTSHYTRADFTALRAFLLKIESETIIRLYYHEDDLSDRGIVSSRGLSGFLEHMRDDLISRLSDSNPHMSEALQRARQSAVWSRKAIDYLISAADEKIASPRRTDPISLWFKPVAAKRFKQDGIRTLEELVNAIRARGKGWYRPIPCIGAGKAQTIETWLRKFEQSLGTLPRFIADPENETRADVITLEAFTPDLIPLYRISMGPSLDGSLGENRHPQFPLISARNDLDAVKAYLYKHRGNLKTYRAYEKELERFLLWCISERGLPMSSMLVSDCEAYKDFLANPPPNWIGVRRERKSADWRPFACKPAPDSQRYAVRVLRAFFNYLTGVRYLSANPWIAVSDPVVALQISPIQVDKALSADLWQKLSAEGGVLDQLCALSADELHDRYRPRGFALKLNMVAQIRLLRAAILILGSTGIRREELAAAVREKLQRVPGQPGIWRLAVLGKRKKWRNVYLTNREIDALRAHWQDRGDVFGIDDSTLPLLSPVNIPPTVNAQTKHNVDETNRRNVACSVEGIYSLVTSGLMRIAQDPLLDLTDEERDILATRGVHAFRHTFGTLAIEDEMPQDIVQKLLGHRSLNTTSVYVKAPEQRAAAEFSKWMQRSRSKKYNR